MVWGEAKVCPLGWFRDLSLSRWRGWKLAVGRKRFGDLLKAGRMKKGSLGWEVVLMK